MAPHLASYPYLPLENLFPGIGIPLHIQAKDDTPSLTVIDKKPPPLPQTDSQRKIKQWLQVIQKEKTISFPDLAKIADVCTKTFLNILQDRTKLHQTTANRIESALRPFFAA